MKDSLFARARRFFDRDLWERDTQTLSWPQRFFFTLARAVSIMARGFAEDQILVRASALTYSTLLALVPALALAFAALKGLGAHQDVEPWFVARVPESLQETVRHVFEYVERTDVRALGAVGIVLLVLTVVSVIGNVERSLNTIWGVKRPRPWLRQVSDYLSIVIVAPVVVFATLSLTAAVQARASAFVDGSSQIPLLGPVLEFLDTVLPSLGTLLPYAMMGAFFTFLYFFLPNTKVKWRSALLAGLVTGVAWQLLQWGYVKFQIGVAKYNAIYGTLAQLPLLLVWIYCGWILFLLGAELAFAHQHLRTYAREREAGQYSHRDREALAVRAMIEIARRFLGGQAPWTAEQLCEKLNAPLRLLNDALFQLQESGLVAAARDRAETKYLLARDIDTIGVSDILEALRRYPAGAVARTKDPYVQSLLAKIEKYERDSLKDLSLKQAIQEATRKEPSS